MQRNRFSRRWRGQPDDVLGGGNGNYFRIRGQRDAAQYMEDERNRRPPGPGGGRLPWILLGVLVAVVLVAFVISLVT